MSVAAAFSSDLIEREVTPEEHSRRDPPVPWWPVEAAVGNQATSVTLIKGRSDWLMKAHKRLASLASLEDDWDSYGASPPTAASIETARYVLGRLALTDFRPSDIAPSAEGGVCLSFRQGNRYGDVECFNSGEVLAVTSLGGDQTDVWEVGDVDCDLSSTLERLRAFLGR